MNFTFLWHFWTIFSPFIRRRIIDICFWRFITQFFTTFASLCASFKFLGPEIEISLFQFRSSAHCKDSSKSGWELYGGSCAYLLLHKYWKEVLSFSFMSKGKILWDLTEFSAANKSQFPTFIRLKPSNFIIKFFLALACFVIIRYETTGQKSARHLMICIVIKTGWNPQNQRW